MHNGTPRPLVQVVKTAAQYGLVIGLLFAIVSGGSKPVIEWIGMVLGGAVWAIVLTVPVVWIKRKLFKP